GDEGAFEHTVRITLEQVAIFVDAGLAFLGIDQQEFLRCWRVAGGLPLGADWKVRAAASAQARVHDQLPDAVATQALGALQRLVTAGLERTSATNISEKPRLTRLGPGFAAARAGPGSSAVAANRGRLPAVARAAD